MQINKYLNLKFLINLNSKICIYKKIAVLLATN